MRTIEISFKKAISFILCIAMTMQIGWAIAGERTNAADDFPQSPHLSASVPSDIRVGDNYQVSVSTDSDGEVSFDYYTSRNVHLDSKPTTAGNYYVIVHVEETDTYSAADYIVEYEIWKNVASTTTVLTVPSTVYVGENYTPRVTTASDGTQTITYRYNDLEGRPERSEKPTEPGSYLCLLHISETGNYYEVSTYESFRIIKRTPALSVTVPNTLIGQTYNPTVTNDSNGNVSITYCNNDAAQPAFTTTKPTRAGSYTVKVTVAETDEYYGAEATKEFTISRLTPEASITVADSYAGDSYEPSVTTTSNGTVSVYYLDDGADVEDEREFLPGKPTQAGSYTAMAVVSQTDTYDEITCTDTFTISKRTPSAVIYAPDTWAGDPCNPTLRTDSDGAGRAVIEYKAINAPDSSYTTTSPTTRGMYMVRATIPETAKYLGTSCTDTFEVKLKSASATVKVDNPFAGTTYDPVITTESDGLSKAVIEYKEKNAPDSSYTTAQPTSYGSYVVRVTIPETAKYEQTSGTADFSVVYLPAPVDAYELTGTKGENDYFTSDVEMKAPEGYSIASSFGGTYGGSIPYTDDLSAIYLRRESDGALTSAVALATRPLIDKVVPSINDQSGALTDGSVLYVKDLTVTALDDNLAHLTINGEEVDLTQGNNVVLSPGNGIMSFKIVAVDIAGNTSTTSITLMAEWLKDRVIPAGIRVPLEGGKEYFLGSGRWKVVSSTGNEDNTVYTGGLPVYANASGDYTLSQV